MRAQGWKRCGIAQMAVAGSAVWLVAPCAGGQDLVREGRAMATIVIDEELAGAAPPARGEQKQRGRSGRRAASPDRQAAEVLVEWIEKMTGATLPIASDPPSEGTVLFIGSAALEAGLDLAGIDSPTKEGLRIVADGESRIMLAGQSGDATLRAACRLLERFGCRYLMDHPLGEVFPRTLSLRVEAMDHSEQPSFLSRRIWGSNWSRDSLWKVWNGAGGLQLQTQHAWGRYIDPGEFAEHPEWFAVRSGERRAGEWYCTSNEELRAAFARGVLQALAERGDSNLSIAPPDGNGYCECAQCRASDDPENIEPSSGRVSMSNRYAEFFDDIARRVGAERPGALLNFYCYADYTQAPSNGIQLHPNLVAWPAPIRACRFHHIGDRACPSRAHLERVLEGWDEAAEHLAYRTYNFNLAECLVPVSLLSVWAHDVPLLRERGCLGINFETLATWTIYAPHTYLGIRLAYDADLDAGAVMEDYFLSMYGDEAGPLVNQYWEEIDRACAALDAHTGSFYAIHRIYTAERLAALRRLIEKARDAAGSDVLIQARLDMTESGLRNAEEYMELRSAINAGDLAGAREVYDRLRARNEADVASGLANHYTVNYLERFLGEHLQAALQAAAAPARLIRVLPDEWRLMYDEEDDGFVRGFADKDFEDASWPMVRTFSDPLNAQGFSDRLSIMWYRTDLEIGADLAAEAAGAAAPSLQLFFVEIDGRATVYLNGVEVGGSERARTAFAVDLPADGWRPGRNVVAVRVDHTRLTELDLGGLIRPVYLLERP